MIGILLNCRAVMYIDGLLCSDITFSKSCDGKRQPNSTVQIIQAIIPLRINTIQKKQKQKFHSSSKLQ